MFPPASFRNTSCKGFNLAEVMVAMVFLTIAMFAVMSVNVYTTRASRGNRSRQIANILASTELSMAESVLRVNFHIPSANINTPRMTSKRYPDYDFVVEDLGYEDPGQNLRGIRSRVFWQEDGVQRSYELSTTVYNF